MFFVCVFKCLKFLYKKKKIKNWPVNHNIYTTGNSILKILAQKYPNRVFLVKNTQIRHFWSQIQAFLIFRKILLSDKFEGAVFKCGIIVFNFQLKNSQNRHFWPRNQAFLFFCEILQINKFEAADFKYDNSFSKFQSQI